MAHHSVPVVAVGADIDCATCQSKARNKRQDYKIGKRFSHHYLSGTLIQSRFAGNKPRVTVVFLLSTLTLEAVSLSRLESTRTKSVIRPYLGYVLNFVGAGMVSGGVVHFPLNESFYGSLSTVGAFVFTIGALVTEVVNGRKLGNTLRVVFLITTSLMLSFGIGMLSGGIQHFTDFPDRATVLIPAGLTLSFLAFCLKNETFRKGLIKKSAIGAVAVLLLSGGSYVALGQLASSLEPSGHSHVEETIAPSDSHQEQPEVPVTETPAEEPTGDGHSDHNHG